MNSDEERTLLEGWGWVFDSVRRLWRAPDGYELTIDDLMIGKDVVGKDMERQLRHIAAEHGHA